LPQLCFRITKEFRGIFFPKWTTCFIKECQLQSLSTLHFMVGKYV
jgi:hypothetical protein